MTCPLVSIVVPIYNVEKYLRQCLESVLGQTYRNLEIILVDDGSTDGSASICDEFGNMDTRFVVIHKANGGPSTSREAGVQAVHGDYAMFLDGDDWLDTDTIQCCMNAVTNRETVECVLFTYTKEYPGKSIPMHIMDKTQIVLGKEAENKVYRRLFGLLNDELSNPERMENIVSCCMKLYRADFVKRGRYYDTRLVGSSEDALFNMYALCGCQDVIYLDNSFYHYRKNSGSLTNSHRPKLVSQWGSLFSIMEGIIEEKDLGEEYRIALNNRIALSITGIGFNELSNTKRGALGHIAMIKEYINQKRYRDACRTIDTRYMPLKWKIFIYCCKHRVLIATYLMLKAMMILKKL